VTRTATPSARSARTKATNFAAPKGRSIWRCAWRADGVERHARGDEAAHEGEKAAALLVGGRRVLLHRVVVQDEAERRVALPRDAEGGVHVGWAEGAEPGGVAEVAGRGLGHVAAGRVRDGFVHHVPVADRRAGLVQHRADMDFQHRTGAAPALGQGGGKPIRHGVVPDEAVAARRAPARRAPAHHGVQGAEVETALDGLHSRPLALVFRDEQPGFPGIGLGVERIGVEEPGLDR
jgi:hypothetical protein